MPRHGRDSVGEPPWRKQAACKGGDTNDWFPEQTGANNPSTQQALAICGRCPVVAQCLQHAIDEPELHGVWGGTTEQERRGMRRLASRQIAHGTNRGYGQHAHWGIPVCQDCKTAHAKYQTMRRHYREQKLREEGTA